jgi:hypothetical protein
MAGNYQFTLYSLLDFKYLLHEKDFLREVIYPRLGSSNDTDVLRFGCRRVFKEILYHPIGEPIFFKIRAHSQRSA